MTPLLAFGASLVLAAADRLFRGPAEAYGDDATQEKPEARLAEAVAGLSAAGIEIPDLPASRMPASRMTSFLLEASARGLSSEAREILRSLGAPEAVIRAAESGSSFGSLEWDRDRVAEAMVRPSFGADAPEPILGYRGAPTGWFS